MHGRRSPQQSSDAVGGWNKLFILKRAYSFGCLSSPSASFVAMMQSTHLREGNDLARGWRMYWTGLRAILVEREVCSGLVIILKIDDDVVETFATARANDAPDVGVLLGRSWRGYNRVDGR